MDYGNKRIKNVLILSKHLKVGGAEKALLYLLKNIDPREYKVDLILVFHEIQLMSLLPPWVNMTYIFQTPTVEAKRFIRNNPEKIYKTCITKEYDIEVAFLEGYSTAIIAASPNHNSYKVAWVHSDFVNNHHSSNAFTSNRKEVEAYCTFDKVVFCSHAAQNAFQSVLGLRDPNKQFVYLPLPTQNELERWANEYEVDEEENYFCVLSRLAPEKGLDRLLYVASCLKSEGYTFKCIIFGDGVLKNELIEKISESGNEESILLKGFRENPYPYLKKSMACICSSKTEALGMAVIEAQLLSIPVIACDTPGTREAMNSMKPGILTANSSEGVLEGVRFFLRNRHSVTKFLDLSNS